MIGDVQARNNRTHTGAAYELLVYALGRQLGYEVTPSIHSGARNIDWRFSAETTACIVEVATVSRSNDDEAKQHKAEEQARVLGELSGPAVSVYVDMHRGVAPDGMPLRVIRDRARRHLNELHKGLISWDTPLAIGDMEVWFDRLPGTPGIVATKWTDLEIKSVTALRRILTDKSEQLQGLSTSVAPRVVVLCDGATFGGFFETVQMALFGLIIMRDNVSTRASDEWRYVMNASDAFFTWTPDRRRRISAVLGCSRYLMDEHVELELKVWHNPNAAVPLPLGVFGTIPEFLRTDRQEDYERYQWHGPQEARIVLRPCLSSP